jgi:sugar/nucleoside kinase (ribokinase family)
MNNPPTYVIAGRLLREYLLPPIGQPRLDAPGGSLLYTAGGLEQWEPNAPNSGLLGKVGEDLPRKWLNDLKERGYDVSGIKILRQSIDLRSFVAYNDMEERTSNNPVTHFARREMTFPKSLLGYQAPPETKKDEREPEPFALTVRDIPKHYLEARAVHICPLDFVTQNGLLSAFKSGSITTINLDPSPGYMLPAFMKDLRFLLKGVTAFMPSEQELRALFWGLTNDLWEMVAALSEHGCEVIIVKRGGQGQLVYNSLSKRRWEIPAYPSRRADPTGAGDAFCGGFLAGYYKTYDPLEAALYGGVSASLKCEGTGPFYGQSVLPGLAEARLSALRELVRDV